MLDSITLYLTDFCKFKWSISTCCLLPTLSRTKDSTPDSAP